MKASLLICWLIQISLLYAVEEASTSPAGMTPLIVSGAPRCAILTVQDDALSQRSAARLAAYLHEHTGARPPILAENDLKEDTRETLIVLDGTPDHRLLARLGIRPTVPDDRNDAYHLRVVRQDEQTIIAVAGKTPSGTKYGTYRLMEEMELSQGAAAVPDLDITASPFFKTRSVSLFNVWRVPVEVIRQCNLESWPAEKIQRNIDTYDLFGFNAIETHDRFHEDFLKAVYGITRAEWRDKVHALCDRAHENGMTVFLRQWGNSVALPVKKIEGGYTPFGYVNLAPDIPEERRRWEIEIRDYVTRNYASHIDHFIGHWADAGGIHARSRATIQDAMLLHNELRAAFRAINPKIETSFNLWWMQQAKPPSAWPGYVDHRTLTRSGVLEKDVMIAQATRAKNRPYSEEVTEEILADGFRAAVWSWRRGDTEVRSGDPGLRVRVHGVMDDYFKSLPESARKLEWHNIERNQHGIAIDVNYYVAAKLMWDPRIDVDAALRKYCALVFGKANAEPMAEAFLTIEASRDLENQVSDWIATHPSEGARRARRALAGLMNVTLAEGHRSRLQSVVSARQMLEEIRGALTVIAENAEICARDLAALDALIEAGRIDEAKALEARLRKKADGWFGSITGGMEGLWLKETLQTKLDEIEFRSAPVTFGFRTHHATSFQQRGSEFILSGQGKTPAIALTEPSAPARFAAFRFQCRVAETGPSRNAGFVFGSALSPKNLVYCQVFIGGQRLQIHGPDILGSPVTAEIPPLDTTRPLDCEVVVDHDNYRVTFRVGNHSVEAELKGSVKPLLSYGYVAENTRTRFGPIEVKTAE